MLWYGENCPLSPKTGELILDPLTLSLMMNIPSKRTDFFGNRVYEQASRSISSGKKSLK